MLRWKFGGGVFTRDQPLWREGGRSRIGQRRLDCGSFKVWVNTIAQPPSSWRSRTLRVVPSWDNMAGFLIGPWLDWSLDMGCPQTSVPWARWGNPWRSCQPKLSNSQTGKPGPQRRIGMAHSLPTTMLYLKLCILFLFSHCFLWRKCNKIVSSYLHRGFQISFLRFLQCAKQTQSPSTCPSNTSTVLRSTEAQEKRPSHLSFHPFLVLQEVDTAGRAPEKNEY